MLVFALVALPPTLIGVIEAIETAEIHHERLRDSVRNYAALASTYHHALIENSTNLLLDVSRNTLVVPEVGQPEAVACSDVLAASIRPFPVYASLVLFDAQGAPLCGSDPVHLPQSAASAEYFVEAVKTKGAYLSGYVLGTDPPVPSLVLTQPLINGAAEVSGVLALAIRLDGLNEGERFLSLPMGGVVYLLDRDGVTLHSVTVPADLGPGGLPPADTIRQILMGQARIFESDARDGVARIYAVSTVEFGSLFLLVGAPKTSGGGWADWNLIAQVTLVFAIWISGVLAAWLGTRFLVTRWTQRLFETTTALGRGDLSARAELEGAPQEIRQLGDTLAEMATRLDTRQGELKAAIEQKEEMLREIHHRIKNNLQTVTSLLNLYSRDVKNEPATQALQNVRIRVQALALVHRHLYESPENRSVNAKALLGELCQLIQLSSGGARNRIVIIADVAPVEIGIDRAVPLALLVTEVVTDALKNGFPGGRAGTVRVSLAAVETTGLRLSITHDGQERNGQERNGEERNGQERDGQPRDGQDRGGQDRNGRERPRLREVAGDHASMEMELSASLIRGFAAQLDAHDVAGTVGAASQIFTFPLVPEHPAHVARGI